MDGSTGCIRSKRKMGASSSWSHWEWNSLFRGIWFILFLIGEVNSQCQRPFGHIFHVQETDGQGTVALNVSAPGGITWTYKFRESRNNPLRNYLEFKKTGNQYVMSLTKPLDLEELHSIGINETGFSITMLCQETGTSDKEYQIVLTVAIISEFPPVFNTSVINVSVQETNKVPVSLVQLSQWASDADYNPFTDEINGYSFIEPVDPRLRIQSSNGLVSTNRILNYEGLPAGQKYLEQAVQVKDSSGLTGNATLVVHVLDVDDLPPKFGYTGCPAPCSSVYYSASVHANATGKLNGVKPAAIKAQDGDALGSNISYSIEQGPAGYQTYIVMDPTTADVTILKPLSGIKIFDLVLTVEAKETTSLGLHTRTTLLISVLESASIPLAAASTQKDDVLVVGIVLGIIIFIILIILIVALIYHRQRYRKAVHPDPSKGAKEDPAPVERVSNEGKTLQERPRTMNFDDEEGLKVDEELTTWLPGNNLSDIVDLSDEDTLKRKTRTHGRPPTSTKMTSRDSAFEESSDKKSGSEDSHKDFDPMTEYAEVGIMSESINRLRSNTSDHVYVPDPTLDPKSKDVHTTDSGVEEPEYLSPNSTKAKLSSPAIAYSKSYTANAADLDSTYSDLISIDGNGSPEDSVRGELPLNAAAQVQQLEKKRKVSNSKLKDSKQSNRSETANLSQQSPEDEHEDTEYSTPRSEKSTNRSSNSHQPVEGETGSSRQLPVIADEDERPEVPPRPKIRQISGLKVSEHDKHVGDNIHYASVQKKPSNKLKESSRNEKSSSHSQNTSTTEGTKNAIDPPKRRKKHRKRSINPPEEDIYDGTKDYEDLEMDPEFYLDTNKTRIKRSTRIPAIQPDPDDTRYWVTVSNEY